MGVTAEHVAGTLAGFSFSMEEIGSVLGRTAGEIEAEFGDLIRSAWPCEAEYVRKRVRRLTRHPGPHREPILRAYAEYQGRTYYQAKLSARVYAAIRTHVREMCVRAGIAPSSVTKSALERAWGYDVSDLMDHLSRLFSDGMSWENWGEWHIDHIRPRASFQLSALGDEAFRECWALSNLQPLWASENIRKGCKHG